MTKKTIQVKLQARKNHAVAIVLTKNLVLVVVSKKELLKFAVSLILTFAENLIFAMNLLIVSLKNP
jgi:hypothetical protein